MSGDINAINSWARSLAKRAYAVALNTGISVTEAKERLIREDRAARQRRINDAEDFLSGRKTGRVAA